MAKKKKSKVVTKAKPKRKAGRPAASNRKAKRIKPVKGFIVADPVAGKFVIYSGSKDAFLAAAIGWVVDAGHARLFDNEGDADAALEDERMLADENHISLTADIVPAPKLLRASYAFSLSDGGRTSVLATDVRRRTDDVCTFNKARASVVSTLKAYVREQRAELTERERTLLAFQKKWDSV